VVRRKWSREIILEEVLKLIEIGEPIFSHHVIHNHRLLYRAAREYFGGWKNVLNEIGIDFESVKRYKTWKADEVIKTIRILFDNGEDLAHSHIQKTNSSLYNAATRLFKSWGKAIEFAGIDYEKIKLHKQWNKKSIIVEIKKMIISGIDISTANMKKINYPLLSAAIYHFSSWEKAAEAAGENYNNVRLRKFWNETIVKENIYELINENDDLSALHIWKTRIHLYRAAVKYFKTWELALKVFGIDYKNDMRVLQNWNKDKIFFEINKLIKENNLADVENCHPFLFKASIKIFGNFDNALHYVK